jgi:hypoxanthine phosphoribosyltransferase
LPRVAEELKIPFVASGGMADGRSLVAALALGADGINMGTRFIATKEAPAHDNKLALVAANELQTRLIMRPLRNTERVLTNAAVEEILAIERENGAATTIEDIRHFVGGEGNRRVLQDGELDAGAWSCGMVAGLIHDIPTRKELIGRIMAEAEVSSYGLGKESSSVVQLLGDIPAGLAGRPVLLVDDIVDTGRTIACAAAQLRQRGTGDFWTCALLDKQQRREIAVAIDFVGFSIGDVFAVGYGTDYSEKYRHLPYIGAFE